MMEELKKKLLDLLGEEGFRTEETMAKHTTFRTGGPADLFLMPQNRTELKESIALLREYNVPYLVIGNGSNLLVGDGGIRGAVIQLYQRMQNISVEGTEMTLDCGALLSAAASQAADASLEGLAFASGIPGTFGGAVVMNAGAYGGEMKDVLLSADVLTADLEVKTIPVEELDLSYRHSIVPEKGYIVLGGKLRLKKGNEQEIRERMAELAQQRREKQPLQYPSAGSTFKRPEGYFAGKLISDAGLKGKTIGGAQVSEKHAGFIVNIGDATTEDILNLIAFCQKTVQEQFGVTLETEVKFVGER
ncbi:UDP-N-acetylmuramate dehydrogenase [Anaerotignum sp.]|uniref:UDP-N-acetylmuramate dehydrogenase n=1 Tax=Anaerotignum sp. TaxID=2039241 RepID=UPI0037350543